MTDEKQFDVNNFKSNITPALEELRRKQEFYKDFYPALNKDEKKEAMTDWNNKPEIKQNGIKAVDNKSYNFIKTLSIFGIIFLLVIASGVGVFSYLAWNDKTLKDTINNICPPVNINVSQGAITCPILNCPAQVSCPSVPDCICTPDININCNNQTI